MHPADFIASNKNGAIIQLSYIYYSTKCVPLNLRGFQKWTSRALPLLSTRWSKTKVLPHLILLDPGHGQVLPNTSPAVLTHQSTEKNGFSCIYKKNPNTFTVHLIFSPSSFGWVQGERNRGQRSSGLTRRSIECCCPHSYQILAAYTLIDLQANHHNRM